MAQGSWAVLGKNLQTLIPGTVTFAKEAGEAFGIWKKIKDRQWKLAPASVRDQEESYEPTYLKRHHDQAKNMWVDKELSSEVSQKDLAKLITYKQDLWKAAHGSIAPLVFGGWGLLYSIIWLGNNTWVPSQFNTTPEQLKGWREAQDLQRYKWAPAYISDIRWFFDFHCLPFNAKQERGWEELHEKSDIRRDPTIARDAGPMYDRFHLFRDLRRKSGRLMGRAMGIPTFPLWAKMCIGTRIRDYWDLTWNEDYMVIKQNLVSTFSDEELYDYAWRRFLAPYDKNLPRDEVAQRVADYHAFLGPEFLEKGVAPNIFITTSYCLGYYNEPGYLEEDISELDKNDYDHLASWGKDAFLRRLEFENGPLRDQVEAHTRKTLAAKAEAAKPPAEETPAIEK